MCEVFLPVSHVLVLLEQHFWQPSMRHHVMSSSSQHQSDDLPLRSWHKAWKWASPARPGSLVMLMFLLAGVSGLRVLTAFACMLAKQLLAATTAALNGNDSSNRRHSSNRRQHGPSRSKT